MLENAVLSGFRIRARTHWRDDGFIRLHRVAGDSETSFDAGTSVSRVDIGIARNTSGACAPPLRSLPSDALPARAEIR
jgi:hypothetical protein